MSVAPLAAIIGWLLPFVPSSVILLDLIEQLDIFCFKLLILRREKLVFGLDSFYFLLQLFVRFLGLL